MPNLWALIDIDFTALASDDKVVVTTDTPCHLWMRHTTTPPHIHRKPVLRRGLVLNWDVRFCFVNYGDNEQEEPLDTITHTFLKPLWAVCEVRWVYFQGNIGEVPSPSTSAFFKVRRQYPVVTADFYPTPSPGGETVDGRVYRQAVNTPWANVRSGSGTNAVFMAAGAFISIDSGTIADRWVRINRMIFTFEMLGIPTPSDILAVWFHAYGVGQGNAFPVTPSINVYESWPRYVSSLEPHDYSRISSSPISTPIAYADFNVGGWNIFPFKEVGRQLVHPNGFVKIGLRESKFDATNTPPTWANNKGMSMSIGTAESPAGQRSFLRVQYRRRCPV